MKRGDSASESYRKEGWPAERKGDAAVGEGWKNGR